MVEHPEACRISLALKERDVTVDFHQPNVVRVVSTPTCVDFEDVYRAVECSHEILDGEAYKMFEK